MKRLGSRRMAGYVTLLLALVIGSVVAVATAGAAPSKKNYTVKVAVTKPAAGDPDPQSFTVTLTNDPSSNTTLGSANVTLPTGFTADTASTAQPGWTATIVNDGAGTYTV